ncbi:uncharacterized protein LOC132726331, partial [Ruditapes philippinarum]|uniref:uncharacterized protein LOC132726331 n=1 Tax=Ruditapes philippinarum TaxID=129788 RepID=UPI00295B7742
MSKQEDMKLSLMTCSVLDYLGFSKKQIMLRSNLVEGNFISPTQALYSKALLVGSSGEGVELADSDYDCMFILSDVICVDEGCDNDGELIILGTDYSKTAPGYTKVVSISMSDKCVCSLQFKQCCTYDILEKGKLISSEKLRDFYATIAANCQTFGIYITQNGPATTSSDFLSDCDFVQSVQFYGGNYLRKWKERVKNYEWPSLEISKEVSEMEGYVVPIGDKQSDMQAFEWRICYTTAEKKLVLSLSDTQIKAYVLLKIMAKSRLKPK